MSLKDHQFMSLEELKKVTPMTDEEILAERRNAYLMKIKDGIVNAWIHREKFYRIEVDINLYHPNTLCKELEELGYFPSHLWQCGSINVYFEPRTGLKLI